VKLGQAEFNHREEFLSDPIQPPPLWSPNRSFNGLVEANSKVLAAGSSTPDDPTMRQSIVSEQLCQQICND
jgi:hypothetical protein